MRDRLIKLLKKAPLCNKDFDLQYSDGTIEKIADHILADGWMRPPVKVGDKVFYVHEMCNENGDEYLDVSEGECEGISIQKDGLWIYCRYEDGLTYWHKSDKTVFLTREEALKALKGGGQG